MANEECILLLSVQGQTPERKPMHPASQYMRRVAGWVGATRLIDNTILT
jgi:hypothetical protein